MNRITELRAWLHAPSLIVFVLFFGAHCARSGECAHSMYAPAILETLSSAPPDSLSHEARHLLGCLGHGVDQLRWRAEEGPSWRLLRNTRREYRDLSRYPGLRDTVMRLRSSHDTSVRSAATIALALYGLPIDPDSLSAAVPDLPARAMILAFLGDSTGVHVATVAYRASDDPQVRIVVLDALYYQATPTATEFIARVAVDPADSTASRARWMLRHPFTREASWRL